MWKKCGDWKPILEKRRNIPIIRDNDSNVSMTLTFYEICWHYEVEHLQNDIELKEPREQTEQITTEHIE